MRLFVGITVKDWLRVGASLLGRARLRTLRNVYGVGSPTVGPTSSSVRLHIYCVVTYMTEISLHVKQNNQSRSLINNSTICHYLPFAIKKDTSSDIEQVIFRLEPMSCWNTEDLGWVELNWLFNVTINDITVIYVRHIDVQADWRRSNWTYGRAPTP